MSDGVWVAYYLDYYEHAAAVFADEIGALRFANDSGYHKVAFWPFGVELADAIRADRVRGE